MSSSARRPGTKHREVRVSCASCGRPLGRAHKYCPNCGTPVAERSGLRAGSSQKVPDAGDGIASELRNFVAGRIGSRLGEVEKQVTTERRLVTAIFADVSGFTSLAERLDPERLLEVIDPVVTRLANVVARYEGYVEKFAGDALLALFGAPVSHEDDAERAVRASIEMQVELARIRTELKDAEGLTLHVGINTGHGIARMLKSEVRSDYAVLGDSVIVAQRLQSAAPSGETYVSDVTYRATRQQFQYQSVGDLVLKGKSEPVRAWRLLGERPNTERPQPRGRGVTARLVGREVELGTIRHALEQLVSGAGSLVIVTGEPGVGKSRLTDEVRRLKGGGEVGWLEARCLSYGAALPYWPYVDLVRGLAGIGIENSPEVAARVLLDTLERIGAAASFPYLARLIGVAGEKAPVAKLGPEAFRRGLHEAFRAVITALANDRPTAIAIEDFHWADSASVALTAELVGVCDQQRVLFYLTARPEAESNLPTRAASLYRVALATLDAMGVAELVEGALGGPPPSRLLPFINDRTSGNPFFVEELVRSLLDTGSLQQHDGIWVMQYGWDAARLPDTLEGIVAARIDLLPLATAMVLETASVIGRRLRLPLLRAIVSRPNDLDADLSTLMDGGFLEPTPEPTVERSVTFHHALVQDLAYSRLLKTRRAELHRQVADAAESLYGAGDDVLDLLARHLYLGNAGTKAIGYLVRAGERARRLFANDEGILHLGRALELMRAGGDASDRTIDVQLRLADLNEIVGNYDEALRLYDEVRPLSRELRPWLGAATVLRKHGQYARALALIDEATASASLADADHVPLLLEKARCRSIMGQLPAAIEVLRTALALADGRRDEIVGHLLVQLARAENVRGPLESALQHGKAAQDIFRELDTLRGLATALRVTGDAFSRMKRFEEAAEELRRGLQLAERVGSIDEIGGCLINLGLAELGRGDIPAGIACDRRAIEEFERIGHGTGKATAFGNLAEKLMHAGNYDEAIKFCRKALETASSIGYPLIVAAATDTMAQILVRQGDLAGAARQAEEAGRLFLDMGAAPRAATSLEIAAKAWEGLGETERARSASERARSLVAPN